MSAPTGGGEGLIRLSESAAQRIACLREREGEPNLMLRIAVKGGGCSGFTYEFSFEASKQDDDLAVERDGAVALIDPMSVAFLAGSEIDFVEELIGSSFLVKNPNAVSACGCGESFAVG